MLIVFLIFFIPGMAWAENPSVPQKLPYYDEIMKIIDPMEYSGFPIVIKPEVNLKIDFDRRRWTLQNIHQYDEQGLIKLDQGRYGLCAELATYLYEKLQPILSKKYDIKFAMATQAGFFPTYESNHIILLMREGLTQKTYLIDPSFHHYGRLEDFSEYTILNIQDALSFIKDKSQDVSFKADQAVPLFIKDDLMVSLSATSVDGKFDRNNFFLVVSVNLRNKISGLNIVIVGRQNNQMESFESRELLGKLLNSEDIDQLHKKLDIWLGQI